MQPCPVHGLGFVSMHDIGAGLAEMALEASADLDHVHRDGQLKRRQFADQGRAPQAHQ